MSRIHASSVESSTTRTSAGSIERARSNCSSSAPTVTGSEATIASATATNASCAGSAPCRQLSGRRGQAIQQPAWASNSPGIRQPSAAGVESSVALIARD